VDCVRERFRKVHLESALGHVAIVGGSGTGNLRSVACVDGGSKFSS
jgi:hypothetical protein